MNHQDRVSRHVEAVAITARGYSPILMPIISGVGIIFAFYDGGSRVLIATGLNGIAATIIATAVGIGIAVLIEGMTIATMVTEDDTRQVEGAKEDGVLSKASRNKEGMFFATIVAILALESGPAIVSIFRGLGDLDLAIFRAGLVVFPFFSRIAASTFSINQVLGGRLLEKRTQDAVAAAKAAIHIEAETKKAKALADLDLEAVVAEKTARNGVKLAKIGGSKSGNAGVNESVNEVETGVNTDVNTDALDKDDLLKRIALALLNTPTISTRELGRQIGISHAFAGNLLAELVEETVFKVVSNGKGKASTYLPNGGFEAFAAKHDLDEELTKSKHIDA